MWHIGKFSFFVALIIKNLYSNKPSGGFSADINLCGRAPLRCDVVLTMCGAINGSVWQLPFQRSERTNTAGDQILGRTSCTECMLVGRAGEQIWVVSEVSGQFSRLALRTSRVIRGQRWENGLKRTVDLTLVHNRYNLLNSAWQRTYLKMKNNLMGNWNILQVWPCRSKCTRQRNLALHCRIVLRCESEQLHGHTCLWCGHVLTDAPCIYSLIQGRKYNLEFESLRWWAIQQRNFKGRKTSSIERTWPWRTMTRRAMQWDDRKRKRKRKRKRRIQTAGISWKHGYRRLNTTTACYTAEFELF